ncbi:MAG TPA: ABC transporter permease subunit [Rhodocyclaceae bacterium]|nr:ABC transporter permease subunit [Rhodocyclaceae bacterium]
MSTPSVYGKHPHSWRALLLQLGVLALVGLALWWLFGNTLANMRARGMHAGFDFLRDPAGFEISESLIDYDSGQAFWRAFLVGLINTLRVAALGIVFTTVLGTLIGIARLSRNFLLRMLATGYVETLRNVPLLLQLLMWYFILSDMLPASDTALMLAPGFFLSKSGLSFPLLVWPVGTKATLIGLLAGFALMGLYVFHTRTSFRKTGWSNVHWWLAAGLSLMCMLIVFFFGGGSISFDVPVQSSFNVSGGAAVTPEFLAVLLALTTYTAAFVAEVIRAGIQSVPRGQIEAASALGLTRAQSLRHVILPLALRAIVPSMTNQYLNLTKNSSLAVAVGYPDLVSIANTSLNQTGRAFECIALIMAVYLTLSLLTALWMSRLNLRVVLRGHQ